jgi:hypothetical protein
MSKKQLEQILWQVGLVLLMLKTGALPVERCSKRFED